MASTLPPGSGVHVLCMTERRMRRFDSQLVHPALSSIILPLDDRLRFNISGTPLLLVVGITGLQHRKFGSCDLVQHQFTLAPRHAPAVAGQNNAFGRTQPHARRSASGTIAGRPPHGRSTLPAHREAGSFSGDLSIITRSTNRAIYLVRFVSRSA